MSARDPKKDYRAGDVFRKGRVIRQVESITQTLVRCKVLNSNLEATGLLAWPWRKQFEKWVANTEVLSAAAD